MEGDMTQGLDRQNATVGTELLTKEGLATAAAQLKLLEDYVGNVLRKDQDYGVIPGTGSKPTLLKPGAANVIAAFNCYPDAHIETETIDLNQGLILYRVRVDVLRMDDGRRRASGQGSCSSYEKKYRYRNALPICPECGKENVRVSKGGGFYCWQKTGGCGANYHHDDGRITSQPIGQVINDDPMEQANTILKMAIKRAEVDAALRLPGVARFFTQDLEDMHPGDETPPAQPHTPQPARPTPRPGRVVDQASRQPTQEARTAPAGQSQAPTPPQPAVAPQETAQDDATEAAQPPAAPEPGKAPAQRPDMAQCPLREHGGAPMRVVPQFQDQRPCHPINLMVGGKQVLDHWCWGEEVK
jgi:hypothetical protein